MSLPDSIQQQVPLAPMTTLGIGGPARFFAEIHTEKEIFPALDFAREKKLPIFILGGGSNLLVADEGFPGLVLRIALQGIRFENEWVTACAGEDWDAFVAACVARNLAGIETLSGIPGLVGGTPVQNVGAYGQEVSETIDCVRAYDRETDRIVELDNPACGFAYRASIFNTTARDRYIVLSVRYRLIPGGPPALRYPDVKSYFAAHTASPTLAAVREAVRTIRMRKSMVIVPGDPDCRSAGSFFKNLLVDPETIARLEQIVRPVPQYPAESGKRKIPAAWLIEQAGFQRGYARGRAGISSKHTLALINRGGASARDILALVHEIQDRVESRFGIRLVPEPVYVGIVASDRK
jgi:UDP-N-acetylmuramate dehydrogenase